MTKGQSKILTNDRVLNHQVMSTSSNSSMCFSLYVDKLSNSSVTYGIGWRVDRLRLVTTFEKVDDHKLSSTPLTFSWSPQPVFYIIIIFWVFRDKWNKVCLVVKDLVHGQWEPEKESLWWLLGVLRTSKGIISLTINKISRPPR